MKLFTVHDNKSQSYGPIFQAKTTVDGIRMFEQLCSDPQSFPAKYPADFVLVEIATYDDQTAQIKQYENQNIVATASDYIKKES